MAGAWTVLPLTAVHVNAVVWCANFNIGKVFGCCFLLARGDIFNGKSQTDGKDSSDNILSRIHKMYTNALTPG